MYPNVKYELQEYELLTGSVEQLYQEGWDESKLLDHTSKEIQRIKDTFVNEIFGFEDERHLERYIQYHQQALIRLMDEIIRRVEPDTTLYNLYHVCYSGLDELLQFVERHFTKYFDQDANVPLAYISILSKDFETNIVTLHDGLLNSEADSQLVEIILYPLKKIIDSRAPQSLTYRKVLYVKELIKELLTIVHNAHIRQEAADEEIRNLMLYLNYNSVKSFAYHTRYIDFLLSQKDSREEMIEQLSFHLKKINQAQVKPGVAYNIHAPLLKVQLNCYITEEIDHLQRVNQLGNKSGLGSQGDLFSSFRVQLDMSVAQVAFYFKLLIETKTITNQNVTELLRFISKILVSKKSETISYDSLRSKYYNVEQGTKNSVKKLLLRMISVIDII